MRIYVVKLDQIKMRNPKLLRRAGKQIKTIVRECRKLKKKGAIIENITKSEYMYSGNGLFYGVIIHEK